DFHVTGVQTCALPIFRIADPWLRHELVSSLSTELRFVIAGRDAPMLEWSTERGRVGGLEILPLVGLTDEAAQAFLADANVAEDRSEERRVGKECRCRR